MKKNIVFFYILSILFTGLFHVSADDNNTSHNLGLAEIDFESINIIDPQSQLMGKWNLFQFNSTDSEMLHLVSTRQFKIWLDIYEDFLQVSVQITSNDQIYQDPPVGFYVENKKIYLDDENFKIGMTEQYLVLTLTTMGEEFRYTFVKEIINT